MLSTVFAVGAVAGGVLLAGSGRSTLRVLLAAGAAISVLQIGAGLAPTILGFAAFILPIAAGAVIFDTVVSTRIQLDTREDMRGRVLATVGMVSSLSGIVGAPLIGWMCDTLGARGSLVTAGAVTVAAGVAGGIVLARLKGVPVFAALPLVARRTAEQLA
jgi:MFS family permease